MTNLRQLAPRPDSLSLRISLKHVNARKGPAEKEGLSRESSTFGRGKSTLLEPVVGKNKKQRRGQLLLTIMDRK